MKTILYFWCFIFIQLISYKSAHTLNECAEKVHRGCTNPYVPTDEEVDRAKCYIQEEFMKADYPPKLPKCPKLYVRRNFKCMNETERQRVIKVLQTLYKNGKMAELAAIHSKCWVPWHKSLESITAHRKLQNELEKAMREEDKDITIPYWRAAEDCVNPHESLIWKHFGTCGTAANNWCVTDCPFADQTQGNCIKRQWNVDRTIPNWYCQDLVNIGLTLLPFVPSYPFLGFFVFGLHFHEHLNCGGYNGTYSITSAPYDFVFYLHHTWYIDCLFANWQLSSRPNLTPKSYNTAWSCNITNNETKDANIETDKLCHYNTPVLDTFYLGFGDMCWVCDYVVQSIIQKIKIDEDKNKTTGIIPLLGLIPKAIPKAIESPLFPTTSNWNTLAAKELDPPDPKFCNPGCLPQPLPPKYNSDKNGERQLGLFRDKWCHNLEPIVLGSDEFLRGVIRYLNEMRYCSPYVTSINDSINTNVPEYQQAISSIFTKLQLNNLTNILKNNMNNINKSK